LLKNYFYASILVGALFLLWSSTFGGSTPDKSEGWVGDNEETAIDNPFNLWEPVFGDSGLVENVEKQMNEAIKQADWK
jgi:hypothetical protein